MAGVQSLGKVPKILKRFLEKFLESDTKPNISDPPGTSGSDRLYEMSTVCLLGNEDEGRGLKSKKYSWSLDCCSGTSGRRHLSLWKDVTFLMLETKSSHSSLVWEWEILNPHQVTFTKQWEIQPPGCLDEMRRFHFIHQWDFSGRHRGDNPDLWSRCVWHENYPQHDLLFETSSVICHFQSCRINTVTSSWGFVPFIFSKQDTWALNYQQALRKPQTKV